MSKLTAWLVTLVGVLLVLAATKVIALTNVWVVWVIALAVLVIGLGKLVRNYKPVKGKK